jgi:ABC-type sugar transport system ATPase subunit
MADMAQKGAMSFVPHNEMRQQARKALAQLGLGALDPDVPVGRLSIAEMQLVEIARTVRQQARVLVLDEPNSALSRRESERLFSVVRQLRDEGVSVIYVSHHLREVLDLADRVTVMRDGRTVETLDNDSLSENRLIRLMVGRDLGSMTPWTLDGPTLPESGAVLLVENLSAERIWDLSFSVRPGEILGIGGLPDSGKDILGEALFGLCERSGRVIIDGNTLAACNPLAAIRAGMAFVPADRRHASGLMSMNVADNVAAASLPRFSLSGLLKRGAIKREARAQVARLDARISSLAQKLGTLSGGNQQKIILGRSLVTHPKVLVLHEPARGIDVGAKAEIYSILRGIAAEGVGILLISSDVPELIMQAARVLVLRDGRISGELQGVELNEEAVLARAMAS